MTKVAINGMGRIGRAAFKIIMDRPELELVAVNDLMDLDNLVYLLNYDTVYGVYKHRVAISGDNLVVNGKSIKFLSVKDPAQLPWKDLGVEIVLECTGLFTQSEGLSKHLAAGAKYAVLSAPPKGERGLLHRPRRHQAGEPTTAMISCASCTTNCITPVVEIMGRRIGVKKAVMTTIHAYTSSQAIVDGPNKKFRRGRAGAANLVPTSTGAAVATTNTLPQYKGKFDGVAVRCPVPCGSLADLVFVTERPTTVEEINQIFKEEADGRYKNILEYATDPIVSSDIIMNSHASIFDPSMTQVVDGDLVKVFSWYDNEWGYTNQMIREVVRLAKQG